MRDKISSGQKIARKITHLSKKAGEGVVEHAQENIIDRFSHIRRVRLLILEWSLLVIAIIILSVTQAYWYSNSYATQTYKDGGTYTEATIGEINSLNPLFASTNSEKALSKLLFSSLSSPDYSGHSGLDLAKSIKTDASGKVWTVRLKDNLKWSDGEPLTNEDVIFTVNLIKNPLLTCNYESNVSGVNVSEDAEKNLVFTLSAASTYFSSALDFPILPKHILENVSPELILENNFSSKPTVSSGPFAYNATQAIGNLGEKSVYLVANGNYYKGRPLIDSFVIHAFTSTDDIVNALNSGTVTASGDLTAGDAKKVTSNNLLEFQSSLNYGVFAFFNTSTSLADKNLRKALQQGINMNEVRSILNGEQPLDFPLTENQIKIEELPTLPKLDTNTAKKTIKTILDGNQELKEQGLVIATIQSGFLPEIAEKLAAQIRSLGISADVTVYDSTQDFNLNVLSTRAYDILVYEVGLGADPDVFAYYHSSEASSTGHNLSNYRNSVVSDLVLSARSTMNYALRAKKYEKFLAYFVEDVPALGIYQSNLNYFVNKNVRTFSLENKLVTATDRFSDVVRWGIETIAKNRTP
ncbi:hypothetical protein IJI76_02650 [Candidatus Saccharibacteria bacterium]|nr:hypothetical protein [Candidatus Saccharibacteria bacterium]